MADPTVLLTKIADNIAANVKYVDRYLVKLEPHAKDERDLFVVYHGLVNHRLWMLGWERQVRRMITALDGD